MTNLDYSPFNVIQSDSLSGALGCIALGKSPLFVTSEGFNRRGVVPNLVNDLPDTYFTLIDSVSPNPELKWLQQIMTEYSSSSFSSIIALGGGSVMDSAKVLSRMLGQPATQLGKVLRNGAALPDAPGIPLITIPTSAGTGAEVTPFATVWDSVTQTKFSFVGHIPSTTILIPALTLTLPKKETLYSGLDALSHALESLWNKQRTATSVELALNAIDLIVDALPAVLEAPDSLQARADMLIAANFAGQAITETRTALAHAMSYSLTLRYKMPHGLACSFTLPALLSRFSDNSLCLRPGQRERLNELFRMVPLTDEVLKYAPADTIMRDYNYELDPSRAGNFSLPVNAELIRQTLSASLNKKSQT